MLTSLAFALTEQEARQTINDASMVPHEPTDPFTSTTIILGESIGTIQDRQFTMQAYELGYDAVLHSDQKPTWR